MRVFDFKGLAVKDKCLICGHNLELVKGATPSCQKKHFNGLRVCFGAYPNSTVAYVYYYLKDTVKYKEYLFFSFQMETMFLATYKLNPKSGDVIVNKFIDFPLLDLDLKNIPGKGYKDYLKTFSVFS